MKYYVIVGEASGDLHASHLMKSLIAEDGNAEFRFFGGDLMTEAAGERGTRVKHFRELAYMGFIPVLLHARTILNNMKMCKEDIEEWGPDVVVLVDYPGFNLKIAEYVHANKIAKVFYYISPKIWAWKEYRIKNIRRDVDELFSILPFEVPFFEKKHHYPIHYVGNPTAAEVRDFRDSYTETKEEFYQRNNLDDKPIIAILAGSRKQEIKDNLPAMIKAAGVCSDYQLVLACAPSIDDEYYARFIDGMPVKTVHGDTYALLSHSTAALVTSGTATLETACFGVPQVVCYETPLHHVIRFLYNHVIKCRFISLVNLIADREVVQEMLADRFSVEGIRSELLKILPGGEEREQMLQGYEEVNNKLGDTSAPDNAARIMVRMLSDKE